MPTTMLNFREENFRDQKADHEIHENIVPRKFGAIRHLTAIRKHSKWKRPSKNVGDIVVLKEDNMVACQWPIACVVDMSVGADKLVRVVTVKTANGTYKRTRWRCCYLARIKELGTELFTSFICVSERQYVLASGMFIFDFGNDRQSHLSCMVLVVSCIFFSFFKVPTH